MRFIHAADVHFRARDPEPALKSLAKIAEVAREREVDLIIVAGDLFDAPIRNSDADSMPMLLDACGALLDAAPVVSVQGTPSHDAPGCYEPIMRLEGERHYWHHIDARSAGKACGLFANGVSQVSLRPAEARRGQKCIITGLPEPSRGWLNRAACVDMEAINETAVERLRAIYGGIGAATHGRTVPHIHVQHGEVRGATLASGQVLPPGGIAFGAEDLALTGADYIALGHIHKQQRLTPRIHYAGSAYPVDWGERDPKSFAVIDLIDGDMDHRLVPYGHPARIKLEVCAQSATDAVHAADDVAEVDQRDVAGADVWLSMNVPADWNGSRDEAIKEDVTNRLMIAGAHGVRVTIERAPRERVRAPEIRNASSWVDQAHAWAEATGTLVNPMGDQIRDIITGLEAEQEKAGAIPQPRGWRIKSLRLRGAIGIWRGSGRDEISIDFEAFDPGVIAITGPNGSGKTTILENCTPWPSMLTRGGPLQQHFRLRDSERDLVIVDDESLEEYRCYIQIDAQTGKREHRVYQWCEHHEARYDGWQPMGADGSTVEYEHVVDELWGPRPLHMLSVVSPQKPVSIRVKGDDGEAITVTTDLASASRGMKRALLRQLLGLGAYQAASRAANETANDLTTEANETKYSAAQYDRDADRGEDAIAEAQRKHSEWEVSRQAAGAADTLLKQCRADLEAASAAAAASREARARANSINDLVKSEQNRLLQVDEQIHEEDAPRFGGAVGEAIIARLEAADQRLVELAAARSDADNAWHAERERIGDQITDVVVERHQHEQRLARASDDIKVLGENIAEMDRTPLTCVECGQPLPEEALINTSKRRAQWVQQTNAAKLHENESSGLVVLCTERERELRATIPERPIPPDELTALRASAADRREALAKARADLQRAQEWATKRQGLEDERARLTERIAAAEQELIKAEWGVSLKAEEDHVFHLAECDRATKALADAGAAVTVAESEARRAREDLERCQTAATKRTELLDAAKGHEQKADAHRLVSTALGADGVQSLLLEHAAPRIAEIATDLLEQSYGARWRVRIELQRTGGQGNKRKMIEDVRFIVRDSESSESFGDDLDPGEQLLETLSGGESVWIKAALSEAIGRVRQERMNVAWRTALRDEADAGLDEGAAASYWRLVEAAHAMSGRHHTVAITHSGAQHAFQQRIELGGGA